MCKPTARRLNPLFGSNRKAICHHETAVGRAKNPRKKGQFRSTIIILSPFFRQNKTGNPYRIRISRWSIVALRNEKGSYNCKKLNTRIRAIVALRNEKGSYNTADIVKNRTTIVALRNEKGSYNSRTTAARTSQIVALRNEKGSYNTKRKQKMEIKIVALRNEKGSYNASSLPS